MGSQGNPATNIAALRAAGTTTEGLYYFDNSISNGNVFAAYCKFNYIDGNDWYLLLKVHNQGDMPSGSALWTNTTLHNETDANLTSGNYAKYSTWNNIEFTNLQMEMHQDSTAKYPPTMHFSTARTFAAAITLAGGTSAASNANNIVRATSTTPSYTTNMKYHDAGFEKNGNNFTDVGGGEDFVNNYGISMWATNSTNSTVAEGYSSVGRARVHGLDAQWMNKITLLVIILEVLALALGLVQVLEIRQKQRVLAIVSGPIQQVQTHCQDMYG